MHLIERAGPTKQVELRMEDVEAEVKLGKAGIRRDGRQWGETFIVIREKAAVLSLTEREKKVIENMKVFVKIKPKTERLWRFSFQPAKQPSGTRFRIMPHKII